MYLWVNCDIQLRSSGAIYPSLQNIVNHRPNKSDLTVTFQLLMKVWHHSPGMIRNIPSPNICRALARIFKCSLVVSKIILRPSASTWSHFTTFSPALVRNTGRSMLISIISLGSGEMNFLLCASKAVFRLRKLGKSWRNLGGKEA